MNFILNNPVTIEDIKIAQQIFGLDIGLLKGKITRKKLLPVINDYITLLPITKSIFNQVSTIATNKGMLINLKIQSKSNSLLYDLVWIAGVDYHQNQDNNNKTITIIVKITIKTTKTNKTTTITTTTIKTKCIQTRLLD
jgi:hypothetical protein